MVERFRVSSMRKNHILKKTGKNVSTNTEKQIEGDETVRRKVFLKTGKNVSTNTEKHIEGDEPVRRKVFLKLEKFASMAKILHPKMVKQKPIKENSTKSSFLNMSAVYFIFLSVLFFTISAFFNWLDCAKGKTMSILKYNGGQLPV